MSPRDTVSYAGKEWFLYITRNVSFWANCLTVKGNYFHFKDFGIPVRFSLLVVAFDAVQSHFFAFEPNYSDDSKAILHSCLGTERMTSLQKNYEVFGAELLHSLDTCLRDTTVLNWQAFLYHYERYTAGLNLTAILGRVGATRLEAKLAALGVPEQKIPETISVITYPKRHTPLFLSQRELYELSAKAQSGELREGDVEKGLTAWHSRFCHIPVNFVGEPWSIGEVREQWRGIHKKDARRELERMEHGHLLLVQKSREKLSEFKDTELENLASTIAHATYLNEYRKDIFSKVSLGFRPIFREIAKLGGSKDWRDCLYLMPEEMTALLEGRVLSVGNLIKKRALTALYMNANDELELLRPKDTRAFASHVQSLRGEGETRTEGEVIKGYSANKGKVTGRVKVISGREDFHKFEAGDILVAMATSVDYIPVMEKAAAFVTNEGGITSHASIVSREMGKPCVIGTKIATKVLKDGDMVEVDAEKGVVTLIQRA